MNTLSTRSSKCSRFFNFLLACHWFTRFEMSGTSGVETGDEEGKIAEEKRITESEVGGLILSDSTQAEIPLLLLLYLFKHYSRPFLHTTHSGSHTWLSQCTYAHTFVHTNEPVYLTIHTESHKDMTKYINALTHAHTSFRCFVLLFSFHFSLSLYARVFKLRSATATNRFQQKITFLGQKCMLRSIFTQFPFVLGLLAKVPVNILIGVAAQRFIYSPYHHQHFSLAFSLFALISHCNCNSDNNRNGI